MHTPNWKWKIFIVYYNSKKVQIYLVVAMLPIGAHSKKKNQKMKFEE